ncbi:hypothetical protein BJ165DRAFT_1486315 [Panaeolus papilionaceus]|nr:hypothetical protein BJ165DRAFT_1486315 [Panaeolus papilionaceus]
MAHSFHFKTSTWPYVAINVPRIKRVQVLESWLLHLFRSISWLGKHSVAYFSYLGRLSPMAGSLSKLLKNFLRRIRSRRVQKLCIRGMLVFIAMMVLILDTRTVRVLGPANIFALALAVVIPPFYPVSLHILFSLAFMIVLLSCWAWANLITASANAARSSTLLAQEVISAESSFIPSLPADIQNVLLIFSGHYLDPRASAVTGTLLFVSTWMYGLALAYYPALAIVIYFTLTLISGATSVNPLIPYPIYTSALTFLISSACYLALCIVAYVFVFPSSFNASWMAGVRQDVLGPIIRFLDSSTDAQFESEQPPIDHLRPHTNDISIGDLKSSMSNVELFKFAFKTEFSVHRLSPEEHLEMTGLFGTLIGRIGQLEVAQNGVDAVCGVPRNTKVDRHAVEKERLDNAPSARAIQTVNTASDTLRIALQIALLDIDEWMRECDMDSWGDALKGLTMSIKYTAAMKKYRDAARKKADYRRVRLEISRSNLRAAMAKFRKSDLKTILTTIRDQNQGEKGDAKEQAGIQERDSLVLLAYLNALNQLGKTILDFHRFLIRVETREPYPQIRLPSALLNLFRATPVASDASVNNQDIESQPGSPSSTKEKGKYREEPRSGGVESQIASSSDHSEGVHYHSASHVVFSSTITSEERASPAPSQTPSKSNSASGLPPSPQRKKPKTRQKSTFRVWLTSNEMVFALRIATVTVGLWVPVVCRNTTSLFERNYGIFAMILGQSYVMSYAGEQVFFFLLRFAGTFLGILLTAACWFIGAVHGGNGRGNGYVLVVITTIFILPCLFSAASGSHRYTHVFFVSGAATMATMIALLWEDVHNMPPGASPARIVFNDLWKRLVMDLIGAAGAFVVMMTPKPTTMRSGFHNKLSSILMRLSEVLSAEATEDLTSRSEVVQGLSNEVAQFEHYLLCMRFDPRVRTVPMDVHKELHQTTQRLLIATSQYLHSIKALDDELASTAHQTLAMVPNILSACYEELLNGDDSTMMKGLAPLDFSAVNSSGFMEIPPNLSNIQSILWASVALTIHDIVTASIELTTLISQTGSGK